MTEWGWTENKNLKQGNFKKKRAGAGLWNFQIMMTKESTRRWLCHSAWFISFAALPPLPRPCWWRWWENYGRTEDYRSRALPSWPVIHLTCCSMTLARSLWGKGPGRFKWTTCEIMRRVSKVAVEGLLGRSAPRLNCHLLLPNKLTAEKPFNWKRYYFITKVLFSKYSFSPFHIVRNFPTPNLSFSHLQWCSFSLHLKQWLFPYSQWTISVKF